MEARLPGGMTVENGLIQTHGGMGLLYWTGGKLGHYRLRVVYKMRDHNDNSGVCIRIPIEPREPMMPVHYGYEVQIETNQINPAKTNATSPQRFIRSPTRSPSPGPSGTPYANRFNLLDASVSTLTHCRSALDKVPGL
jgi:hypothetical protein